MAGRIPTMEELEGRRQLPPGFLDKDYDETAVYEDLLAYGLPPAPVVAPAPAAAPSPVARARPAPLAAGESGAALSPEPERPRFGPLPEVPGMKPEQVEAVYKFAADNAKGPSDVGAPVSRQQMEAEAMKLAEQEAGDRRMWAGMREAGSKIASAISDTPMDEAYLARLRKDAELPVEKAKREQALAEKYAAAVAQGKEREFEEWLKREQLGLQKAEGGRKGAADRAGAEEEKRHNLETEKIGRLNARRNGGGGGGGSPDKKLAQIPAGEAQAITQFDEVPGMLDDLGRDWEALANQPGVPDSLTQYWRNSDAGRYKSAQLAKAQAIGTVLERGKLTDSDLKDKYMPLMPTPSDSQETKDFKIAQLRKIAADKYTAAIRGLEQAGFDVSGYKRAPQGAPAPQQLQDARGQMPKAGTGLDAESLSKLFNAR